jgi:hypothetical protein
MHIPIRIEIGFGRLRVRLGLLSFEPGSPEFEFEFVKMIYHDCPVDTSLCFALCGFGINFYWLKQTHNDDLRGEEPLSK